MSEQTPAYRPVPNSRGPRRAFALTVGLREGYGPTGKTHSREEAVEAALAWMKGRAASGLPFITGAVSAPSEVVYAWPEGPGQAGGGHEPVVRFEGEVSPLYGAHLHDEEVVTMLEELAATLGSALGQTRVYASFKEEVWILQREEASTPTGETV